MESKEMVPVMLDSEAARARFGTGLADADRLRGQNALADVAEEAVREIEASFEVPLTGTEQDLEILDELAGHGWHDEPPSEEELAAISLAWGAYVGELIQGAVGGTWVVRQDSQHNSLVFERLGLEFFPVHAVLRRFALDEQLSETYERLSEELQR